MNCTDVTERIAAHLDGQLSPGESELVGLHLDGCPDCHALTEALMAQDFDPLSQEEKDQGCSADGFWDSMDVALKRELEGIGPVDAAPGRWRGRRVGLPVSVVLAYAAAMLLAVVWGLQNMDRADSAEVAVKELERQLEQEARLAAEPQVRPTYRTVGYDSQVYTPKRSTF